MLLNDLKGHFRCLKPFQLPYLVKKHEFTNRTSRDPSAVAEILV